MHIERYRETVNQLASTKSDTRFSNKGNEHAQIVVEAMVRNAIYEINIFSGRLSKDFYTSSAILDAFKSFFENATRRLTILTEFTPDNESVKALTELASDEQIIIRSLNTCSDDERSKKSISHFMTADGQAYRFEIADASREAVVNFNEPDVAQALNKIFDAHLNKLTAIA